MRVLIGLVAMALSCSGEGSTETPTPVERVVVDGMIAIPAARVKVGGGMGPPPGAPGPPPGAHGKAAKGAPPPIQPMEPPKAPEDPKPWEFHGGVAEARMVEVAAFEIDATEVTRAAYAEFLTATGYRPPHVDEDWARDGWNWDGAAYPEGTGEHPVVLTNYYDAVEYCLWKGKRLPTEAEWQLAALGPGEGSTFPWGEHYEPSKLNHGRMTEPNFDASDGYLTTSPVGSFPQGRSPYGLDDAFGNAWEFTSDWRVDDNRWLEESMGLYVAVRGGSYFFDVAPNPKGEHNHFKTEVRRKTSGFRCAR